MSAIKHGFGLAVTHRLAVCGVYIADQQSTLWLYLVIFDALQKSDWMVLRQFDCGAVESDSVNGTTLLFTIWKGIT